MRVKPLRAAAKIALACCWVRWPTSLPETSWIHIEQTTLSVKVRFATFADWWDPFTLGVGPAGSYVT